MKIEKSATFMSNYNNALPSASYVFQNVCSKFLESIEAMILMHASNSIDDEMFYFQYQVAITGSTHENVVF